MDWAGVDKFTMNWGKFHYSQGQLLKVCALLQCMPDADPDSIVKPLNMRTKHFQAYKARFIKHQNRTLELLEQDLKQWEFKTYYQ